MDLAVDVDLDLEFDGFGPRPGLGEGHRDLLKVWWISIQLGLFSKQLLIRPGAHPVTHEKNARPSSAIIGVGVESGRYRYRLFPTGKADWDCDCDPDTDPEGCRPYLYFRIRRPIAAIIVR